MKDFAKATYEDVWADSIKKKLGKVVGEKFALYPIEQLLVQEKIIEPLTTGKVFELCATPGESVARKMTNSKATINCPVDVYVYDRDGNLCGAIVNNAVDTDHQGVFCTVSDETKYVYLAGDDYSLRLVGNDTGTMSYTIEKYLDGELCHTIAKEEIPLSVGKTYTGIIPDSILMDKEVYELTGDSGEVIEMETDIFHVTGIEAAIELTGTPTINGQEITSSNIGESVQITLPIRFNLDAEQDITVIIPFFDEAGRFLNTGFLTTSVNEDTESVVVPVEVGVSDAGSYKVIIMNSNSIAMMPAMIFDLFSNS